MTHYELTLKHLQENGTITTWEAIKEYGNTRLSDTIFRLRRDGFNITDTWIPFKNRYGIKSQYKEYKLEI